MSEDAKLEIPEIGNIAEANEHIRYSIESQGGRYCLFTMNVFMDELIKTTAEQLNLDDDGIKILQRNFGHVWGRMNSIVGASCDYMEMFQHHVVDNQRLTSPVLFRMNDLGAKIMRSATFVNHDVTSRRPTHGHDDKRWLTEPLPYERLVKDKQKIGLVRIPMKADTGLETIYGYYELFVDNTIGPNGKPLGVTTTMAAFRTKEKYIIPNSIYRWYIVEEDLIRKVWRTGRDIVPHPIPSEQTEGKTDEVENN